MPTHGIKVIINFQEPLRLKNQVIPRVYGILTQVAEKKNLSFYLNQKVTFSNPSSLLFMDPNYCISFWYCIPIGWIVILKSNEFLVLNYLTNYLIVLNFWKELFWNQLCHRFRFEISLLITLLNRSVPHYKSLNFKIAWRGQMHHQPSHLITFCKYICYKFSSTIKWVLRIHYKYIHYILSNK